MIKTESNLVFRYSKAPFMFERLSVSSVPNPSSITRKLGLGRLETLIRPTRRASEETNFSIPDERLKGHSWSSYRIYTDLYFSVHLLYLTETSPSYGLIRNVYFVFDYGRASFMIN